MSLEHLADLLEANEALKVTWIDTASLRIFGNDREVVITTDPSKQDAWVLDSKWLDHPEIVVSKLIHKLGLSNRIHARKCSVQRVDKSTMDQFLQEHHINGVAGAKHKFGLFYLGELVSLASFATPRVINEQKSGALVRFCVKSKCSISGGLDKLLQHYIKTYPCDDIFTYVDLSWSTGNGFKRLGFRAEGTKELNGKTMLRLRLVIDKSSSHPHI